MAVSVQSCFLPEWHAGSYSTRTSRLGVHFDWTLKRGGACAKKGMGYNNSFGELHETATKIYTLKLPPVYKETKVYIKCYLFRFLSSIYKVVQVQHIQHTARASNQLFPRFLFVLYDCTRYIFQLSVLLYKGTCYQLLQLLQLLPKQQYILKSLCLSPGPGTLLHVALSPILRAVAGCQKTRLCLLLLLHHFFYIRLCWIWCQ